ncbi:MAG TPA: ribosome biogenesis GTPase Der [Chlamydiales bacterium]|nr:ribosome biogenesis GTPase Der [Chlamydiales bacterium]
MLPKIALVGRPNVGKSALFNRICQKRISIVDEQEGITRDRLYAETELFGRKFILIDTGGIDFSGTIPFHEEVKMQAEIAIEEADVILLVVDGQIGPNPLDEEVAKKLLKSKKPVVVAVNKIDQMSEEVKIHAFHSLALRDLMAVSAMQGYQIVELLEKALSYIPVVEEEEVVLGGIKVAIVGRPNVGKSTLLNELLDEERSIVSPIAGTTRDAIDVPIVHEGQDYLLIDTAGIRRKKAEKEVVDKFAAMRTEEAIDRCDVCVLVLDSFEGFTTQEKRIAAEIEAKGRSCILVFNKWDLMHNFKMEHALRGVREEIPFLNHCPTLFISATKGRNLNQIFPAIKAVYAERQKRITTGGLNKFIEGCLQKYHPPLIIGKRLRIYYMTQVEVNPPKFVLFVNNPTLMTESYRKYLVNQFREIYSFSGCPLILELRGKAPPAAAEPRLL